LRRFRIVTASAKVVGSATAGPDPMTARSLSITSERIRLSIRAPVGKRRRRPPPLSSDRCFLTAFSSAIGASVRINAALTATLSVSEIPAAGTAIKADAPPLSRNSRSSCDGVCATNSSAVRPAASDAASGSGCDAHSDRTPGGNGAVGTPCGAITNPSRSRVPTIRAAAAAIPGAALPTASILIDAAPSSARRVSSDGCVTNARVTTCSAPTAPMPAA
jgi:hypothetical protein